MILFPVLCDPLVNRCSYIQHINKTALSVIRELPTVKSNGHSPVFALLDFAVASKTIHYPLFLEDVSSLGSALQTSPVTTTPSPQAPLRCLLILENGIIES